ncbi:MULTISPECIES: type II toxin-antitoxin system VapC family toxin [Microcoleaceae]|uniref:type II toxin-antitoxin system VapC family toxin n=1 Tax=Microcoleaceae TaxID=1892252 RepID=UPI001D1582F2|nr:hypothetical protein [Tychonema sp. LEGE 06208]
MKLLLDTHIWLWYLLGDPRLSRSLQMAIGDRNTELWLSPISQRRVRRQKQLSPRNGRLNERRTLKLINQQPY